MRARLVIKYILSEMIPMFLLGVVVFVLILLMFQALRLTEFVVVYGIKASVIGQMVFFMSTSFLPILFPMSLIFTVILTYGRLSADSEMVAFKAVGLRSWHILTPAMILSAIVAIISLQTSFHLAPWGNRQFEVLIQKLGSSRPAVTLREGTFSESFFDLVVYANKIDPKTGLLSQVFIYDERNPAAPITMISQEGEMRLDPEKPGNRAALILRDGNTHLISEGRHTKIDFSTYELFLDNPVQSSNPDNSPQSMTVNELQERLTKSEAKSNDYIKFTAEIHKRIAISVACLLFGMIGVGLGTATNRRSVRSGGTVLSIGIISSYWVLYILSESLAQNRVLPPALAMWLANILFALIAFFSLRRARD